ncbi:hypothetical protein [Scytonema sp. UIC 10036]|uniref:hypothetical protein n=1 Tax=Scytonema sp. UIC 10036 TaxID=2304196 RepID=UPI0012DA6AD4|nr:hypothetical protein [Scytonema sp. UIC 10036]
MTEHSHKPKNYDAVLGGNNQLPINGVVLGGLPGVKKRLMSGAIEVKIAALQEAIAYGQEGLHLVIQALNDESKQVQRTAYLLLRQRTELEVLEAISRGISTR